MDGETLLSPVATRALVDRFRATPTDDGGPQRGPLPTLTDRERELTGLAVHGLSNQGIGERLLLSPLTVLTHVHRAMAKLGARDRAQLVVIACQEGLVRAS